MSKEPERVIDIALDIFIAVVVTVVIMVGGLFAFGFIR